MFSTDRTLISASAAPQCGITVVVVVVVVVEVVVVVVVVVAAAAAVIVVVVVVVYSSIDRDYIDRSLRQSQASSTWAITDESSKPDSFQYSTGNSSIDKIETSSG